MDKAELMCSSMYLYGHVLETENKDFLETHTVFFMRKLL